MSPAVKFLVSVLVVVSLAAAVYTSSTGSKVCFNVFAAERRGYPLFRRAASNACTSFVNRKILLLDDRHSATACAVWRDWADELLALQLLVEMEAVLEVAALKLPLTLAPPLQVAAVAVVVAVPDLAVQRNLTETDQRHLPAVVGRAKEEVMSLLTTIHTGVSTLVVIHRGMVMAMV
jgi:hypothetical protein